MASISVADNRFDVLDKGRTPSIDYQLNPSLNRYRYNLRTQFFQYIDTLPLVSDRLFGFPRIFCQIRQYCMKSMPADNFEPNHIHKSHIEFLPPATDQFCPESLIVLCFETTDSSNNPIAIW